MAGGLLLLIGLVALRGWAPGIRARSQGRYLLPLLPLFGALLALAARGAGERWGRARRRRARRWRRRLEPCSASC